MPPLRLPKVRFLGRPVRPVAFGLTLAMLIIWPSAITDHGLLDGSVWGDIVGWSALVCALVMMYGWWKSSQRAVEVGLQMVFFLMVFRFVAAFLVGIDVEQGGFLSLAWAVVAGGSYLLEKADPEPISG